MNSPILQREYATQMRNQIYKFTYFMSGPPNNAVAVPPRIWRWAEPVIGKGDLCNATLIFGG